MSSYLLEYAPFRLQIPSVELEPTTLHLVARLSAR